MKCLNCSTFVDVKINIHDTVVKYDSVKKLIDTFMSNPNYTTLIEVQYSQTVEKAFNSATTLNKI